MPVKIPDMTRGSTVAKTSAPQDHVASILDESSSYYVLGSPPRRRPEGHDARTRSRAC